MHRMLVLFSLFVLPVAAAAKDWNVDAKASSLGFSGIYQGEKFEGRFKKFDAAISLDPADLASAKFDVSVDVASATTDNEERDSGLPGEDFFNAAKYPKAHFVTSAFRKAADGNIEADGTLSVRDKSKPVTLKVKFAATGSATALDVDATVNRLDFDVGVGDWKDTSMIGKDVAVHAHLSLSAKQGP